MEVDVRDTCCRLYTLGLWKLMLEIPLQAVHSMNVEVDVRDTCSRLYTLGMWKLMLEIPVTGCTL